MPQEVINCLNTCLLISPSSMRDFACRSLEQSMTNLPMTAILHPHVLSTTMFAWAFGMNWQRLTLSAGQEDLVDFSMITADDIIGEFRVAHDTGVRSQMERIIARRLREYHGLPLSGDAASVMSYGSKRATPVVKVTKPMAKAPFVVDASQGSDDASEVSLGSVMRPADAPKEMRRFSSLAEVPARSSEEKGGIQTSTQPPGVQFSEDSLQKTFPRSNFASEWDKPRRDQNRQRHHEQAHNQRKPPFIGSLIDLTRLDPEVAEDILGRINVSKISPKSSSSGSKPIADVIPETGPDTSSTRPTRLDMAAGTTPAGKPVKTGIEMTPAERHALEYLAKVRQLTPDVKEVKRASLPSSVKFNGDIEKFEDFCDAVEGHYRQQQASYLFKKDFARQYEKYGPDCYINFPGVTSANQVIKDVEALYGALQTACQKGSAKSILLKYKETCNGVAAWHNLVDKFGSDGDPESRIEKLEKVINTPYSRNYKGGLKAWLKDYENAFAELEVLGETAYLSNASKKRKVVQNCVARESNDSSNPGGALKG